MACRNCPDDEREGINERTGPISPADYSDGLKRCLACQKGNPLTCPMNRKSIIVMQNQKCPKGEQGQAGA